MKYDQHAAYIYDVHLPRRVKHFDDGHGSFHDLAVLFASNDAFPSPFLPLSSPPFLAAILRREEHECIAKDVRQNHLWKSIYIMYIAK